MGTIIQTVATPKQKHFAQDIVQGRGLKDPILKRMSEKLRGWVKHVVRSAAQMHKCHPSDIVWKMDRQGIVKVDRRNIGRIG